MKAGLIERFKAPKGYVKVPGGNFNGEKVKPFAMKKDPVTKKEWSEFAQGLGEDRFVLMAHDASTGMTHIVKRGKKAQAVFGKGVTINDTHGLNFEMGDVMISGNLMLLKITDDPSVQYNGTKNGVERVFNRDNQPVVGVSWFHAMAYCLLKSDSIYKFDLPTGTQFEYVASKKGKFEYGIEPDGELHGADGKMRAHLDAWKNGTGTTIDVTDKKNGRGWLGIQVCGNVWRWTKETVSGIYKGLRAGSWLSNEVCGRASFRYDYVPQTRYDNVGFSPVVVSQDSK